MSLHLKDRDRKTEEVSREFARNRVLTSSHNKYWKTWGFSVSAVQIKTYNPGWVSEGPRSSPLWYFGGYKEGRYVDWVSTGPTPGRVSWVQEGTKIACRVWLVEIRVSGNRKWGHKETFLRYRRRRELGSKKVPKDTSKHVSVYSDVEEFVLEGEGYILMGRSGPLNRNSFYKLMRLVCFCTTILGYSSLTFIRCP